MHPKNAILVNFRGIEIRFQHPGWYKTRLASSETTFKNYYIICLLVTKIILRVNFMATLDTVYWKFGYASEAAQLLEVELINVLIEYEINQGGDISILKKQFLDMDKYTLGRLDKMLQQKGLADNETLHHVALALKARNYLAHEFYRTHNYGRYTPQGRQKMLDDLKKIHNTIFEAYRKVLLISGNEIPPLEE